MWTEQQVAELNTTAGTAALARQATLTKPPGSLGRLEEMAVWLAERQGTERPQLEQVWISVFAGDHGVMEEAVSAFPQVVTGEMLKNFAAGGAAISVLARSLNAHLEVVNLGVVNEPGPVSGIRQAQIAPQTGNITRVPAMSAEQLDAAMTSGKSAAERASERGAQLFIAGDMGIGNTTSAAALSCAYLSMAADALVGPGTGLDLAGVARKVTVVDRALTRHRANCDSPREILRHLGGFEIAAMTGAMIRGAQLGLPVLVDGYIATAAALAGVRIQPAMRDWLYFSHCSAEPGHAALLDALDAQAVLDFGMRLGEASGAAVVVPLLRLACDLHNNMATFAEAGVSEG